MILKRKAILLVAVGWVGPLLAGSSVPVFGEPQYDPAKRPIANLLAVQKAVDACASPCVVVEPVPRGRTPDDPARADWELSARQMYKLCDTNRIFNLELERYFLEKDQTLKAAFYESDGLRLNAAGRAEYAKRLKPLLDWIAAPSGRCPATPIGHKTSTHGTRIHFRHDARQNYARWWWDRTVGKLAEADALRAAGGELDILFIGDSLTHRWEYENTGAPVLRKLTDRYRVLNVAIGGDRWEQQLWMVKSGMIDGLKPRYVSILLGANNHNYGQGRRDSPERTRDGVKEIIDAVRERCPNAQFILYPMLMRLGDDARTREMREKDIVTSPLLRDLAEKEGARWVEFDQEMRKAVGGSDELRKKYTTDFTHLSRYMFEKWYEALKPILASRENVRPSAADAVSIDLFAVRVTVAQPKNASVALAAKELEKHLALVAGSRRPSADGVEIVLGAAPAGEAAPAAFASHGRLAGGRLYFWGDDGICTPGPGYSQQNYGTLFAVYGFLQDVLGVRWVEPGDDGIVYKARRRIELKDGWSSFFEPKMMLSYVRTPKNFEEWSHLDENAPPFLRMDRALAEKRLADRQLWMLRMRHLRRKRFHYGHAFTRWQDRFLKTHPEYLALSEKGERGLPWATTFEKSKRALLCISNEAVADQIISDWKAAGTPEFLNVSPNDSDLYCHCGNCCAWDEPLPGEAFGAHKADRYVRFWNRVIAKAKAIRPDVKVVSYLYVAYRFPPRKAKLEYPDNFIGGIVPSAEEDSGALIAGWKRAGLRMFFVRPNYLCYKGTMPRGYERFLVEDFQRNLRDGMIGVDEDNYPRAITYFETYAISRVIAETGIDFGTVEREFLSQYGAAAPEMREYYARVRARGEKGRLAAVARNVEERRTGRKPVLDDSELFGSVLASHLEPDLDGDLAVIDRALARKGLTELERRRIRRTRDIVEHAKRVRRFVFARDAGDPKAFEAAAVDVLEWRFSHKETLGEMNWGRLFRGYPMEVRWWMNISGKTRDRFWNKGTEKETK